MGPNGVNTTLYAKALCKCFLKMLIQIHFARIHMTSFGTGIAEERNFKFLKNQIKLIEFTVASLVAA